MWFVITAAALALVLAVFAALTVVVLGALSAALGLMLNVQKDEADKTIWVLMCPKTKHLAAVEVSCWRTSKALGVTDCFNRHTRAICGQACLEQVGQKQTAAYADS